MERLKMQISGMSCGHCVKAVERVLAAAPGVKAKRVEVGRAEMDYDPAQITPVEIARRIEEEGYTAEVV